MKGFWLTALALVLFTGCANRPGEPVPGELTTVQASALAEKLANDKSQQLYQCQPFRNEQGAKRIESGWVWHARRAWGSGDIEAIVNFAPDGTKQEVKVFRLYDQTR
jgi:hypothetical protein